MDSFAGKALQDMLEVLFCLNVLAGLGASVLRVQSKFLEVMDGFTVCAPQPCFSEEFFGG